MNFYKLNIINSGHGWSWPAILGSLILGSLMWFYYIKTHRAKKNWGESRKVFWRCAKKKKIVDNLKKQLANKKLTISIFGGFLITRVFSSYPSQQRNLRTVTIWQILSLCLSWWSVCFIIRSRLNQITLFYLYEKKPLEASSGICPSVLGNSFRKKRKATKKQKKNEKLRIFAATRK